MRKARDYHFRSAGTRDLAFAETLYLATMEPLLSALGAWDRQIFRDRIRASFSLSEIRVITSDGRDIGFIHLIETASDLNIAQLHLIEDCRGHGIGSRILTDLIARASHDGRSVSLSVPRNNRARGLYRRLGFVVSRDDGDPIIDMRRAPDTQPFDDNSDP